jgi:5-methylcytosine-specific restriction endonuclease McrA
MRTYPCIEDGCSTITIAGPTGYLPKRCPAHTAEAKREQRRAYHALPAVTARRREWARDRYLANPEAAYEQKRRWRGENPDGAREGNWRTRARRYGVLKEAPRVEEVWAANPAGSGRCNYCLTPLERHGDWELDHATPISRGGLHELSNLVVCCSFCNRSKGARTADEFLSYRAA